MNINFEIHGTIRDLESRKEPLPYLFMKLPRLLTFLLAIVITSLCTAQTAMIEQTLVVPQGYFQVDEEHQIILANMPIADINEQVNFVLLEEDIYTLVDTQESINTRTAYEVTKEDETYTLFFTALPIISIESNSRIDDEPKVPATLHYADSTQQFTSYIGIELRGRSSRIYSKKTYDLEFWEDVAGDDTRDVALDGLREDDDYILDAIYNEPLRLRSHISHQLWLDLHQPYYLDQEPEAKSGADVRFVEVFLNNQYQGVFNLSEQIDRKQLKLKKFKKSKQVIRGELFQGDNWGDATVLYKATDYDNDKRDWNGFILKYPQDTTDWSNLHQMVSTATAKNQELFEDNIWQQFNYDNFIDYFIFVNVVRATDNTGKNIYVARYDNDQPYFYVPWDLDGVFGTQYYGKVDNITDDVLGNSLQNRLMRESSSKFKKDLETRWKELRKNLLSTPNLIKLFEDKYNYLNDHKIYERESMVQEEFDSHQLQLEYIKSWTNRRMDYLDTVFIQN
ncbi:CotH kinase family protein [Nonlabens ponticola]|uniref:Spore coat protein CotH n=1 Tax=Nonlabens ponticola TaxID=2496866 RepID=A0A3S9MZJ0_9FLAO|nr:CotH kinase family protein [Nonlabens ponticola]AZQ44577.1 hypothetical protein EJ995_10100 [Nonlabens ponticola]